MVLKWSGYSRKGSVTERVTTKGFNSQESEFIDLVISFLNYGILVYQNKEKRTQTVTNVFCFVLFFSHRMDSKQNILHSLLHNILREPPRKAICSRFSHEKMEFWRSSLPKVTQTSLGKAET